MKRRDMNSRLTLVFGTLLVALVWGTGGCLWSPSQTIGPGTADVVQVDYRAVFDELDLVTNRGKGYSEYLNTEGFPTGALTAWAESRIMDSYLWMYRATGDEAYLDRLVEHIDAVLQRRDDVIGYRDFSGALVPAWGSTKYSTDGSRLHFAVHTGMITYPIARFCLEVQERNVTRYVPLVDGYLEKIEESVRYHDREWEVDSSGRGYYIFPESWPFELSGRALPINQQAAMGRTVLALHLLTGEDDYLEKARSIADLFKMSLRPSKGDSHIWSYWSDEEGKEDISHGAIELSFAILAYQGGLVFEETDMRRFVNTFYRIAREGEFSQFVDGTGGNVKDPAGGLWVELAAFDEGVYQRVEEIIFGRLRLHRGAKYMEEDWRGVMFQVIARMAYFGARGGRK